MKAPRGASPGRPVARLDRCVRVVGEHAVHAECEELLVLGDRVAPRCGDAAATQLERQEAFSLRNVYGCTASPAAWASVTNAVGCSEPPPALRGTM